MLTSCRADPTEPWPIGHCLSLGLSTFDREQPPQPGNALEFVLATLYELDS